MDHLLKAINKAVVNGCTFYAYRLPGDRLCHFSATSDCNSTSVLSGFKVKPFDSTDTIIIPQSLSAYDFCSIEHLPSSKISSLNFHQTSRSEYNDEFDLCLEKIRSGILDKIVLSKVIVCDNDNIDWGQAFNRMVESYPNAFVFIYNSPRTGAWAGASPETLARYHDATFTTMALAGTKPATDKSAWREKELTEQEYVANYIESIFSQSDILFNKSEKKTVKAGNVKHLCNFFDAHIPSLPVAEQLVDSLHPTPALCGLPTDIAKAAIRDIERNPRQCYGGYVGPFSPSGFDYFVNLRSMAFDKHSQALFCGGGLTIDSVADDEWTETEAKALTMKGILSKANN